MKKIYLISTIFIIGIISFFNLDSVKADKTCTYEMKSLESLFSTSIYTEEYYTIEITIDGDNKYLTFTNVYYDPNFSDDEKTTIHRGEKERFTFDEILEEEEFGFTVDDNQGSIYSLSFKPIVQQFNDEYSDCDVLIYEYLIGNSSHYRFRFKDSSEECDGPSADSENGYGNIKCLDPGKKSQDDYTCSPDVASNSYTSIKYSFSQTEKKMMIEFPNSGKQTLYLDDLKLPDAETLATWEQLGIEFDDSQIANLGGLSAVFDAKDCIECFEEFHTAASGHATFSEYVQIAIDKELSDMLFSNDGNSCPAKIYAKLTFQEWGDTYKPQYNPDFSYWWSSGASGVINAYNFFQYVSNISNYNYSDYNFASIELTTKDCGTECFKVTTGDTVVIVNPDNPNIDFDEIGNCSFLKADEFYDWISTLFKIVRIGSIILVIVLTGLDAMKTFVSFDEKNGKNFYKHLLNRLICVALLFLLPSLIELIINFFNVNDIINKIVSEPFCGLLKK